MHTAPPPGSEQLLNGRFIASLATHNPDGSIHLAAVWYLFENSCFYVATSSRSRKARNLAARPQASLMIDTRKPAAEHAVVAIGTVEIISGEASQQFNTRIHHRYMSPQAVADSRVGGTLAAMDDITLKLAPTRWYGWDMAALDDALFHGAMKTPGYLLPLD